MNVHTPHSWTIEDAKSVYGFENWSEGYFDVSEDGEVTVQLRGTQGRPQAISLLKIVEAVRGGGTQLPLLLRIGDLLEARIQLLYQSFAEAIAEEGFRGSFHGVYPVKVNQQQQVIEQVTRFGRPFHHGLETGSKAELMAALAYLDDPEAYLICNGYKDSEFIDLALRAQKMGFKIILVVEMPREVSNILESAAALGVEPTLGIRVRLAAKSSGHWRHSAGDKSVFGLHMNQVMRVVEELRAAGKLHCLRMLHFHQGSQIPKIRALREAAMEATRIYVDLVAEGAPMGLIDLGGGLAVDYEGNQSSGGSSANYGIKEYCSGMVDMIKRVTDMAGVEHPDIIAESGRAVAAYGSVLIFDIVDVNQFCTDDEPVPLPEDAPEILRDFEYVWHALTEENLQECVNDTLFYRDQLQQMHVQGNISLRERAMGESLYARLVRRFGRILEAMEDVPDDMLEIANLGLDSYYGNFSLFRSLPDSWGIKQIFPVAPLHRLKEAPTQKAVLSDITCDCDGRIDRFAAPHMVRRALPVHAFKEGDAYYIGVFLVGAYQEAMGNTHNLLGSTNTVSVSLDEKNQLCLSHGVAGDSVTDALRNVDYELEALQSRFKRLTADAVATGRITPKEGEEFAAAYEEGLRGYTYFEDPSPLSAGK